MHSDFDKTNSQLEYPLLVESKSDPYSLYILNIPLFGGFHSFHIPHLKLCNQR